MMSNSSSSRVPKYCRHKGKNLAYVRLNNRVIYLGKYGSAFSKSEYRRLIAEYLQSGGLGISSRQQETSVIEVMAVYLSHAKQYYRKHGKPTREYEMIRDICRIMKQLYGETPAAEFGPQRLKTVRQEMIAKGHSRKFINKNIQRVQRIFIWCAAEELIPAGVPQALAMVSGLRKGRTEARETAPVGLLILCSCLWVGPDVTQTAINTKNFASYPCIGRVE